VEAVEVLEHATLGPLTLVNAQDAAAANPVFVEETLRTALQANVGSIAVVGAAGIEKAKQAMTAMQAALGSDAAGKQRMLGIYVNLAQGVEQQMKSAPAAAKQELSKVFEAFLQELGSGSSDLGVINWVGETFASLGDGFDEGGEAVNESALTYYQRSVAAFQNLLSLSNLPPALVTQVKARMAAVKVKMRDFEGALRDLKEILQTNSKAINLQVEAARLLQAWGNVDSTKLELAIAGVEADGIWGWGKIANATMQHQQFRDSFYEARYEIARCQLSQAVTAAEADKAKLLSAAERNLATTKQLYPTLGGEKWMAAYDELTKQIQASR
jgi:tetratricopeptide (TPR) repeat protein